MSYYGFPQQTCPSCGHCPTCGNRPYYSRPYWSIDTPYPTTWVTTTYPSSGGTASVTITGNTTDSTGGGA